MNCACGMPLHYNSSMTEEAINKLSNQLGEFVEVKVEDRKYKVQRHYIALHGIKAAELDELADRGIVERLP